MEIEKKTKLTLSLSVIRSKNRAKLGVDARDDCGVEALEDADNEAVSMAAKSSESETFSAKCSSTVDVYFTSADFTLSGQ